MLERDFRKMDPSTPPIDRGSVPGYVPGAGSDVACLDRLPRRAPGPRPTKPHYYTYRDTAASLSRLRHAVIVISPIRSSGGGLALFQDVYFSDHICVASGPWPYISQSSKPQAASAASIRSASPAGHRPSSEQSSAPWYLCANPPASRTHPTSSRGQRTAPPRRRAGVASMACGS